MVYSERFILARQSTGSKSYTVPAGKRAVVRSITAANLGAAGVAFYLRVNGTMVWVWSSPGVGTMVTLDSRIVLYGGDTLEVLFNAQDVGVQISGYLFSV